MDISAVLNVSDDVLKDMGLSTAGDRLSLRGFVAPLKRSNTRTKRNPKDEDSLRHSCLQRKIGRLSLQLLQATNSKRKSLKRKKKSLNEYKLDGNTSERRLKTMFLYLCLREMAVGMQPCCYQVTEQTL